MGTRNLEKTTAGTLHLQNVTYAGTSKKRETAKKSKDQKIVVPLEEIQNFF